MGRLSWSAVGMAMIWLLSACHCHVLAVTRPEHGLLWIVKGRQHGHGHGHGQSQTQSTLTEIISTGTTTTNGLSLRWKQPLTRDLRALTQGLRDKLIDIQNNLSKWRHQWSTSAIGKDAKLLFLRPPQWATSDEIDETDRVFFDNLREQNDQALGLLNDLLVNSSNNWSFVAERHGVRVHRRYLAAGPFVSHEDSVKGSKHACVKSSGIINATAESVFNLLQDANRIREYNNFIVSLTDSHRSAVASYPGYQQWSKVSYTICPRIGPFKVRDFCSVVNCIAKDDGSFIVLNRPAYISRATPTKDCVRATILLGANIITPVGEKQTLLTQIAHINPGGGADTKTAAWILNKLCAREPPRFFKKVERAANRFALVNRE